jgi:hypothetical protein
MLQYKAVEGQNLLDICLNTYGSLDFMIKLLQDNDIDNINVSPISGQLFTWDETLTVDQLVNQISQNSNIVYATKFLANSPAVGTVQNGSSGIVIAGNNEQGQPGGEITPSGNYPSYIGSVDSLTPSESEVKAMTVLNGLKADQSINYTVNFKRFAFFYPAVYGNLSSIKDTNDFEIKSGFTKSTVYFTVSGSLVLYYGYTLTRPTTQTNFNVLFKF